MALTKLPKNALGTGSVDADKIEDGTIQNAELAGSLSEDKFATGTIANAKLSNSSITVRGTARNLGDTFTIGVDVDWQSVQTGDFTASAGRGYFVNTTSAVVTVTLPVSATLGDTITIKDYAGTFASNNLTIGRNGHNIQGVANDSKISTNRASLFLVYVDATKGWLFTDEHNVADLQQVQYVAATGGTITTSGDFKIHSFTGDGCFVVSCGGNPAGADTVDYLVVAGGGAGGGAQGGGGGAGGFRLSNSYSLPAPTTSPLASPTGLSVTTTTYPITVGGGGTAGTFNTVSNNGSNSVFSTVTSVGGGRGAFQQNCCFSGTPGNTGGPGGSGGGANRSEPGGVGNTPPVSPPQGNNGGVAPQGPNQQNGGGGGAGAVGGNTPALYYGGAGAIGSYVSPSLAVSCVGTPGPVGSTRYFSGGGGGSGGNGPPGTLGAGGSGGSGGGAPGTSWTGPSPQGTSSAPSGTTNTGGGGGGVTNYANSGSVFGGAGGSGIVILRYKFQN